MGLYLVQHGDAVDEAVDPTRPLSPQGRADVEALARACMGRIAVRHIIHSGKLRAEQTAEILGQALGAPVEAAPGLTPGDPPRPVAEKIAGADDLLIVSHLPFLERLTGLLVTGDDANQVVAFQRGGMVCLEKRSPESFCILWTLFPRQPGAPGAATAATEAKPRARPTHRKD